MIEKRSEPLCVPNEVLINILSKEAKKKNTVLLSGEGADEVFGDMIEFLDGHLIKKETFQLKNLKQSTVMELIKIMTLWILLIA